MDTTRNSQPKRLGAPEKPIVWPNGTFTVNSLKNTGLSRVTLQNKIASALENSVLVQIGTDQHIKKMGRASRVYRLASVVSPVLTFGTV